MARTRRGATAFGAAGRAAATLACLAALASQAAVPQAAFAVTASEMGEAWAELESREAEAEAANERLNGTRARMAELDARMAELEASVAGDAASLRAQMRGVYKGRADASTLSAVASASTFAEMASCLRQAGELSARASERVSAVAADRRELAAGRAELEGLAARQGEEAAELDSRAREASEYYAGLGDELRRELGVPADADIPTDVSSGTGEAWRDIVLMTAYANLGGSYVWGGSAFKASDCSGLTMQCYARAGMSIPHGSELQAGFCDKPISQAVPGDVVWRPGHVGIYVGNGRTIEAHNPRRGITWGTLSGFVRCGSPG